MNSFNPRPAVLAALESLRQAREYANDLGVDVCEFCIGIQPVEEFGLSKIDLKWMLLKGFIKEVADETHSPRAIYVTERGLAFLLAQALQKLKPKWLPEKRQLTFNGRVIKQFRVPSCNQEAVLMAFEEEGWPSRIYDPLIPKNGIEMKRRVTETIKSMNRWHKQKVIRFFGDGTGRGICWRLETEPVAEAESPEVAKPPVPSNWPGEQNGKFPIR